MSSLIRTNRRQLLQTGLSAAALCSTDSLLANTPDDALLVIDCHAHIYGEDESRYPTIEEPYRPPRSKGTLAHLRQEMMTSNVRFVTAIQTSTYYRFDNRFTADTSRRNKNFMVGIVTLDPDDPASPAMLERDVRESNVRGLRSIPAKSGRLDDPGVKRLWDTAQQLGIVINVLTGREQRDEIASLVKLHPQALVVLDHCLNLKAGPMLPPTLKDLLSLAQLPQVHAKLTFIPTGSAQPYPFRDMHDACRRIIGGFGPDRCVWGSNFPCELWCPNTTYAEHLNIFTRELGLDLSTQQAVLGQTARRLWFGRSSRD